MGAIRWVWGVQAGFWGSRLVLGGSKLVLGWVKDGLERISIGLGGG